MESKVGRMGSSFYTLFADDQRLAYLWQRALFTDLPNTPPRQRLELYEVRDESVWAEMFAGLNTVAERIERFQEYVCDGEITLRKLLKSPTGRMCMLIYDGEQLVIDTPPENTELTEINGIEFPKSLAWSNLIIKERV